jgi:hypothetical protein
VSKTKKHLTDDELVRYRMVMATIEAHITDYDREARAYDKDRLMRKMSADYRDAWTVARDALEKIIRREQERRIADAKAV